MTQAWRLAGLPAQIRRWQAAHAASSRPRPAPPRAASASTEARQPATVESLQRQLAAGEELTLACTAVMSDGRGLCKHPCGLAVFVERALPGEVLTAVLTGFHGNFATAAKRATLQPHAHAVPPLCQHFAPGAASSAATGPQGGSGGCGGCTYQSLGYGAQLAAKQQLVADAFERLGGCPLSAPAVGSHPEGINGLGGPPQQPAQPSQGPSLPRLLPILPAPEGHHYRNKVVFQLVPPTSQAPPSLGLHVVGEKDALLPIARCELQDEGANAILRRVNAGLQSPPGSAEHLPWQVGSRPLFSLLTIRQGASAAGSRGYMVTLHRSEGTGKGRQEAAAAQERLTALLRGCPGVATIMLATRGAGRSRLEQHEVLWREGPLYDVVAGLRFEVQPGAFFQTNTRQAAVLVDAVRVAAGLKPGDRLLDLYCGSGLFSLALARHCAAVRGLEASRAAVAAAAGNARLNGITNASFAAANLSSPGAERVLGAEAGADVVVVDPARAGLSGRVTAFLRTACTARRLVYVSCHPATLARDVQRLCSPAAASQSGSVVASGGTASCWRLVSVQAVDMFPQTAHVEVVALLERP